MNLDAEGSCPPETRGAVYRRDAVRDNAGMLDARKITALAAALIVAQTIVRAWLVIRGDFYGDDLLLIAQASSHDGLGWSFFGQSHDGHLMPGAYLVVVVSTYIAPLQWWLPAATLVVGQVLASLAVWRAIRIIAPNARGGALAALAFYLFVPMTVTSFVWWAAGLNTLPFQAALAWVVGSTVVLVRDEPTGPRRTRLVVGAVAAFAVGLVFFEKSLVILPVALVVALLAVRHDRRVGSLLTAVFSRAKEFWAAMGVVFVAWAVLFFTTSTTDDGERSASQMAELVWRSVNNAIVPSFAGGPWVWELWPPAPPMGLAPVWMIVVGWLVIAALVVTTVRARRGAAIIWVFAAVYAVGVQIPVMWLRSSENTALELAQTLRYLPDTALVFALAFALIAAGPAPGGSHAAKAEPDRRLSIAGAAGCGLLVLSAMVGTSSFSQSWSEGPTGDYLTNARQAMKDNAGRVMFDQAVPIEVLHPVTYPNNQISRIFGRLHDRPDFGGYTDRLVVLAPDGRAVPGAVTRSRTIAPSRGTCRNPGIAGPQRLRLDGPLFNVQWTIQLSYCANIGGDVEVGLEGGQPLRITVEPGLHAVYLQVSGQGDRLRIRPVTPGLRLHTGEGRVGLPVIADLAP